MPTALETLMIAASTEPDPSYDPFDEAVERHLFTAMGADPAGTAAFLRSLPSSRTGTHPRRRLLLSLAAAIDHPDIPVDDAIDALTVIVRTVERPSAVDLVVLALARMRCARGFGRVDEAAEIAGEIRTVLRAVSDSVPSRDLMPFAWWSVAVSDFGAGRVEGVLEALAEARRWAGLGSTPHPMLPHIYDSQALTLALIGRIEDAGRCRRRSAEAVASVAHLGRAVVDAGRAADALRAVGSLQRDDAERLLRRLTETVPTTSPARWLVTHVESRISLYWSAPARRRAVDDLRIELLNVGRRSQIVSAAGLVLRADLADLLLSLRDYAGARDALAPALDLAGPHPLILPTAVRLAILTGDRRGAVTLLGQECDETRSGRLGIVHPAAMAALRLLVVGTDPALPAADGDVHDALTELADAVAAHGAIEALLDLPTELRTALDRLGIDSAEVPPTPFGVIRRALTRSERTVVEALPRAETNADLAAVLHLSPHTVKNHLASAYRKLGVSNRRDAVRALATL